MVCASKGKTPGDKPSKKQTTMSNITRQYILDRMSSEATESEADSLIEVLRASHITTTAEVDAMSDDELFARIPSAVDDAANLARVSESEALDRINGTRVGRGYIYYADETDRWYTATIEDIVLLRLMLAEDAQDDGEDGPSDPYSEWCSVCPATPTDGYATEEEANAAAARANGAKGGRPAKAARINACDIRSAGIRAQAQREGIEYITLLGDNGKSGDARIDVYQFAGVRVADTNGDPIWEESDPTGFAELLQAEGINL